MRRLFGFLISTCIVLGALTSCVKVGNAAKSVVENNTYFDSIDFTLGDEYLYDEKYSSVSLRPIYYGDECIYLKVCLDEKTFIEKYDFNGSMVSRIDVSDLSSNAGYSVSITILGDDEKTYLIASETDYGEGNVTNTLYDYSCDELLKIKTITIGSNGKNAEISKAILAGNEIFAEYQYLDNSIFHNGIAVISTEGECLYNCDIEDSLFQYNYNSSGNVILSMTGSDGSFKFQRFNMNDRKIEELSLDDVSYGIFFQGIIGNDGNIYVQKGNKILKYDIDKKEQSIYLDCNFCGTGMYSMMNDFIDYIDDETIVLLDLSSWRNEKTGRCKINILKKTENNPYYGRKIIEVAEIWGVSKFLSDGINTFNANNSDLFAYVSDRYDINVVNIPQMYTDIVSVNELVSRQTYISSLLMQDIRNGEGPDIVVGLGDVTQINNDMYLKDLNDYINGKKGINGADYFENAFEAFSTNDKQYQLPLSIQILGIMTSIDNAPSNGIGYTYDEYIELVNGACNGFDPINCEGNGRNEVFNYLFASMQSEFILQDGSIDIENDKFRTLAEYVKDNTLDSCEGLSSSAVARWRLLSDVYYDMVQGITMYQSIDIYGAPSFDGRGPMVTSFNTIAMTTCVSSEDDAWNFIKCLLSKEVQSKHTLENPINLEAFDVYATDALEAANVKLQMQGSGIRKLDETDIEHYKKMLLKAESPSFVDTQIVSIMTEELQYYYQGSKSIDDVIVIIVDRCQTVLNERK